MNKLIHIVINILSDLVLVSSISCYTFATQQVTSDTLHEDLRHPTAGNQLSTPFSPVMDPEREHEFAINIRKNVGVAVLPDSSNPRTYVLQEVVVTSARVPQTAYETPSSITVLSRSEIEGMNGTSLAQVVSSATGVFVKDYGATSGLKTMSQRGLGTEHTLILLNGLRVSSMQNGLVDLGLIPVDDIESVEIVRGGQSALYGADAVAGIINIVTRPAVESSSIQVSTSLGSFGYKRYQISGNISSGSHGIRLGYGEERSNDDFPYQFRNGPNVSNLTRSNSDLSARYSIVTGTFGIGEQSMLHMVGSTYSSERGVGGEVVSRFSRSWARQIDTDHLLQASLSSVATENVSVTFTGQIHSAYERYLDPNLNIGGRVLDTYFRNDDIRIEPHVDVKAGDEVRFTGGSELVHTTANGNSLARGVKRKQLGTFLVSELQVLKTDGAVSKVTVFPALRCDAISSMAPTWSPQVGAFIALESFDVGRIRSIRSALRSSVSRNFRMPTFNELYFSGGGGFGNSALRPERSTNLDIGASTRFLFAGEHSIQATYFINDMTDRIVWVPAGSGSVMPKNLRHVRSVGFETSYRWDMVEELVSFQASYTSSDSRKVSVDYAGDPTKDKQLIHLPKEIASLSATGALDLQGPIVKELGAMVTFSFVGHRYYTEDNGEFLPSHQLVNASVRSSFVISELVIFAKVEVGNLFNEEYQVMLGFPMPMRSYRLTIGAKY